MPTSTCFLFLLTAAVVVAGCQSGPQPGRRGEDNGSGTSSDATVNLRAGLPPGVRTVGQMSESPTWRATERGIVYIYNQTHNRLVGQVFVREGQELVVSGPEGRVTLDGNEVDVGDLRRGRTFGLYFLPTADAGASAQERGDLFRITPASNR